jgi:hypothetical protein
MRKVVLLLPAIAITAACETLPGDRSTQTGAAAGALIGAAVADDDNRLAGAVVGGAAGAVAGNLIGRANSPGDCIYRDQNGNRYVAECP